VVNSETLHDADCPNCIPHLSQLAFEFLYVVLDRVEVVVGGFTLHPRVVDDVLSFNPLGLLNGQQFSH
jgi:hypothetical protein